MEMLYSLRMLASCEFWIVTRLSFFDWMKYPNPCQFLSHSKFGKRPHFFHSFFSVVRLHDDKTDTAAKKLSVSKVQLTADIDAPGGKLTVNPSYNLDKSTPDCRLGYSIDGTSVQVDAQGKKMTIAHCFDNNDVIAPSVSASGDFSLSYTRSLEGGKLTTTWAPNKAVQLQWADGDWQTTMKAPLDGLYKTNQGIKVSMKRTVGVF